MILNGSFVVRVNNQKGIITKNRNLLSKIPVIPEVPGGFEPP